MTRSAGSGPPSARPPRSRAFDGCIRRRRASAASNASTSARRLGHRGGAVEAPAAQLPHGRTATIDVHRAALPRRGGQGDWRPQYPYRYSLAERGGQGGCAFRGSTPPYEGAPRGAGRPAWLGPARLAAYAVRAVTFRA